MRTSAGVTYLHGDHLGSTSVASDANGNLFSRQTYYPYGAPRTTEPQGSALPTDYTFTGQKFDASAGLMYYGARYYDAGLGRFISADTVVSSAANPQALNRYAYVLNNPVRYTDPTGYREQCEFGVCPGKEGTWTPPDRQDWDDPQNPLAWHEIAAVNVTPILLADLGILCLTTAAVACDTGWGCVASVGVLLPASAASFVSAGIAAQAAWEFDKKLWEQMTGN